MKRSIAKLNGKEYIIESDFKEEYNNVVIYSLENNTPSPISSGIDLKGACKTWFLKCACDLSHINLMFTDYVISKGISQKDLEKMGPKEVNQLFEKFFEENDGLQLFIWLKGDSHNYYYIDWTKVEEFN